MINNQIGIVSIATNKYLEFYFDLINSFKENCPDFSSITFYLFTDRIDEARKYASEKNYPNISTVEIPNLGWPDASLMRYKIFDENRDVFTTDILVYLDSDMLILQNPLLSFGQVNQRMTFVRHPGYYFEFSTRFIKFLAKKPRKLISLIVCMIKFGGIGSWENRRLFAAYVPRQMRKHYFCGGGLVCPKTRFSRFLSFAVS